MIERKMRQIQERKKRQEDRKKEKAAKAAQQPALGSLLNALGAKSQPKDKFVKGMSVKIVGTTAIGIVEKVEGNRVTVQFGMVRSILDAKKLVPTSPASKDEHQAVQVATYVSRDTQDKIREVHLNFHPEIDIRGMRGDEALDTITHYIDNAILVGASRVRILHGTGNGILRQLIRQYLNTVPQITSARDEDVRFGGAGITVVEIKG
jgi:DNA mismatch repair protein MutS2